MTKPLISVLALSVTLGAGAAVARGPDGMALRQIPSFEELDRDGNGGITLQDIATFAEERRAASRAEMVERLMQGAGEDGLLSAEELTARLASLRAERGERTDRRAMGERMFNRVDANSDGVIDPEEYAVFADRLAERMENRGKGRWGRP